MPYKHQTLRTSSIPIMSLACQLSEFPWLSDPICGLAIWELPFPCWISVARKQSWLSRWFSVGQLHLALCTGGGLGVKWHSAGWPLYSSRLSSSFYAIGAGPMSPEAPICQESVISLVSLPEAFHPASCFLSLSASAHRTLPGIT